MHSRFHAGNAQSAVLLMRWLPFLLLALLLLGGCQASDTATPPIVMPATPAPTAGGSSGEQTPSSPLDPVEPTEADTLAGGGATPVDAPDLATSDVSAPAQTVRPITSLSIEPVAGGFNQPTSLTHAGDERLFVTEQHGVISIIRQRERLEQPFLNIQDRLETNGSEQGLLGLAFHPDYPQNGLFFVNYTGRDGETVIARYQRSEDPDLADADSEVILLRIEQPFGNHNGGQLQFGPDGLLYIGMGDGGSAGDPENNGQNPQSLLGALLRIDVDNGDSGSHYAIPADNPFADNPEWRGEIWSIGLRNPWRFSFDRLTGDLYVADVGQNQYEEVHFSPLGDTRGLNYGWPVMEGKHCYREAACNSEGLDIPVAEYEHSRGCSITGGYVYRGARFPQLAGLYFFADYCEGTIWSLVRQEGQWLQTSLLESDLLVSAFGEDRQGELYVLDHARGIVYALQP